MSKIDYQALREAAVAIETVATPQKLLAFRMKVTPQVVLELLDERERNQQYIKSRDQENEDIALTVWKLRVKLEAAEMRIAELESLAAPKLTQKALVVPDEMPEPDTARMFFTDAVVAIAKVQGWNACRAAMLHGSEPETDNTNQQFESLSRDDK